MKRLTTFLASAALLCLSASGANPKEEFRGAWLHTVHQGQYAQQTTEENKAYLIDQLDRLQAAGCNAVVFQVRPSADAFYPSELEPWSQFLSGTAGKAPSPVWDPLQFMIDECHSRGMELHAWLNPYRVTTKANQKLPKNHIYHKYPERFLTYDGKLYFDPGLPENREFIISVVDDIISRYEVDAIHMDDYFYPYPVAGKAFPDDASFAKYGNGKKLADWRRENVDLLIEGIHNRLQEKKPWVRFGISPFGVFRNKSAAYPEGSDTKALQNYDDLYADVLLWTEKGWVDYMLPQLYWEIGHSRADYAALVPWWAQHANGRHMYVGQDVEKRMKVASTDGSGEPTQLRQTVNMMRQYPTIQGNCWWPGYSITRNSGGVADSLAVDLQSTIALVPAYEWMTTETAPQVPYVEFNGKAISWGTTEPQGKTEDVVKWVVYYAPEGVDMLEAIKDAKNIRAVTMTPSYTLPKEKAGQWIVTGLNRANRESLPVGVTLSPAH
ncbi:MAG: family 10 glycosylhydrolase [Bacteroidales bacterium]|nr:family 10 glycosylhydrolase [Bacteroidales bacterium]